MIDHFCAIFVSTKKHKTMKTNRLYEFNIDDRQDCSHETKALSEQLDQEIDNFFESLENIKAEVSDIDTLIIYLTENKYKEMCYILDKYNASYYSEDISDVILSDEILDYYYNIDIVNEYRSDNLSIDDVLDKVSSIGLDGLNEVDIKILETKKSTL
jgi:hypothetical protein